MFSDAGERAMAMYDKNKDGKISGVELDLVPAIKDSLKNFNTTKEKGVTAADINNRVKAWQDTRVGLMGSTTCVILHNGKPLAGAEVKFVPEKFLSDSIQESTGTTTPEGFASMTIPVDPNDPGRRGVPPGWYKVEITKTGENIPAKYNLQTTIGAELAPDVRGDQLRFDLKY